MKAALAGLASLLVLAGCAADLAPQRGLTRDWVASPNFDERRPSFVVLHYTASGTTQRALDILTTRGSGVSSHYLISRDGRLTQLVDERMRAWHAGDSLWGANADINSASIGIELVNTGEEPYAEAQIAVLLELLAELKERYRIPAANFIGHGDVAPQRKKDPGPHFPWRRLAERGFGLWCDSAAPAAGDTPLMLRAFGYDVSDPAAAVAAFRRHFRGQEDGAAELTDAERGTLRCLLDLKRP